MRICESCGRENADDADFCACGEYLRWEPTNYQMPAIVPPVPAEPEPEPPAAPPPPAAAPPPPPAAHFVTAVQPAAPRPKPAAPSPPQPARARAPQPPPVQPPPSPSPPAAAPDAPAPAAAITLRLPDDEPSGGAGALGVAVVPGDRVRVIALVRNQSSIVDNYTLVVHGLPSEWYTVTPETVYLVPFGSAGAYEQEVEISLHPPRTPEAEARRWELRIGVVSRAIGAEVTAAPMTLGIHPYEEYALRVRPERASGRRRAKYDVSIANKANAVVLLALDAADGDDACDFRFDRSTLEVGAGATAAVRLRCRPPRQIWLGRPLERRFEIACASGAEGEKLLKERADAKKSGGGLAGLGGKLPKLPGVSAPKVDMPNVDIGPAGDLKVRMPNVRGPHFQGVNLRRPTLGLKALRMPDRAAAPAVASGPLLPTQAIFRQKPWLPWWLAIVVPLLALLGLMVLLLMPKNVKVPDVVGSPSVFEAEKKLVGAGLQLGKNEDKATTKDKPGTILGQTPEPGASAKKGAPVSLQVAVGTNVTVVPKLVGLTFPQAEKALRAKKLQPGGQPPDLKTKIASSVPGAGQSVKEGSPIDLFYPDPAAGGEKKKAGGAGAAPGAGGSGPKDIAVPEIAGADQQGYAGALQKAGLLPGAIEQRISEQPPGTVFGTEPAVGEKVAKGAAVRMLVSAGFPRIAYDDDKNVLLGNGASGQRITPAVAETDKAEKDPTWSADGASIVYTADQQLFSADMIKRDRAPTPLGSQGVKYADPSFAPIKSRAVLAVSRIEGTDHDLCVGRVKLDEYKPQCIADPSFDIGFAHWSPDGKTILAFATSAKGPGIVQYTSKRAFSAQKSDWGKGEFVTPRAPGKGVLDAAISPDGKQLAAVANFDSQAFQLYLTTPDDIRLHKAKPLPVNACKVMWLDNRLLALVKLGDGCDQDVGEIVRVDVADPTKTSPLAPVGDNPTFEPLSTGG